MTRNVEIILFCIALLSQTLLISGIYAARLLRNRRYVLANFPPSTHPRLYPQPLEYYHGQLRNFVRINLAIGFAGVAVIIAILGSLAGLWDGGLFAPDQQGQWAQFIVAPYFVLQCLATVYLDFSVKHRVAMVKSPPPRVRTTELRRRQLTDFVSPVMLVVALATNIAFIAFVLYFRRFEFPWFTATGNIIGVGFMLLVFTASVAFALYTPKPDPFQAPKDHRRYLRSVVQYTLACCIVTPALTAITLLVKLAGDPEFLAPVVASLFCQGFALILIGPAYTVRVEDVDYDVYRPEPRDATPGTPAQIGVP